ncbi:DUF2203 family protein [Granulicella sp. WH15]|uniref:DUF2203 domain-containing protein n=1 Tax=Granulicella sp. WH15 TaxID=2602070 RepID=UPI001367096E|nr:DUF2203 domain-containing protein [Granulicella sp. WH15]QHN04560.1 DUF2203 family protein [Granulicella sp. WH15]
MSKTFTLSEAQTLIPVLESLVHRARSAAIRASTLDTQMQELSQRIFLSGGLHVDVPKAARRRAEREKAMQEARDTVEEIEEIGASIADLDEGRLELPAMAEGRIVLLCWTMGDAEIVQWRESEEGSPLRRMGDGPFGPSGRERERPN